MGRNLVTKLLELGAHVTLLNRGKTPNPFPDCVQLSHLRCDRLNERQRFRNLLRSSVSSNPWTAVIDYVCFSPRDIEDVVESLAHAVGHYILISTDSVYMACCQPYNSTTGGRLVSFGVA